MEDSLEIMVIWKLDGYMMKMSFPQKRECIYQMLGLLTNGGVKSEESFGGVFKIIYKRPKIGAFTTNIFKNIFLSHFLK